MLSSASIIEAVAAKIREHQLRPLVVDPVMVAKSGDQLLRENAVSAMREQLLPLATVLTPNIPEAEVLLGRPISTWEDRREAAKELVALGPAAVVVKGGHVGGDTVIDLLYDGHEFRDFTASRVDTRNTHGTGCTFASAITAALAKGENVRVATAMAKAYVTKALQMSYPIGHGHGPVHHFFRYWQPHAPREDG
jgi:hydroxymethylpyrimidine/phosphomethylpyrimidine kinase